MRVAVVRGDRAIPAGVDRDDVDPRLGVAVETTPIVAVTDGGKVTTDSDAADASARPDDCCCWDTDLEIPCFECWLAGYETQNPETPGADDA